MSKTLPNFNVAMQNAVDESAGSSSDHTYSFPEFELVHKQAVTLVTNLEEENKQSRNRQ